MKPPLPPEPNRVEVSMAKPGIDQETSPPSAIRCSPGPMVISRMGMVVPAIRVCMRKR